MAKEDWGQYGKPFSEHLDSSSVEDRILWLEEHISDVFAVTDHWMAMAYDSGYGHDAADGHVGGYFLTLTETLVAWADTNGISGTDALAVFCNHVLSSQKKYAHLLMFGEPLPAEEIDAAMLRAKAVIERIRNRVRVESAKREKSAQESDASTKGRGTSDSPPVYTELQTRIIEELSRNPMQGPELCQTLERIGIERDESSVKRALKKLKEQGVVANRRGLGYFLVDNPPKPITETD